MKAEVIGSAAALALLCGCQVDDVDVPTGLCDTHEVPEEDSFGRSGNTSCGVGGRVTGSFSLSIFVSDGGAGETAIDFSRSNIPIPAEHSIQLTIKNSQGSTLAQQLFAAQNVNNRIEIENPTAADNWLLANSSSAASVEVTLSTFSTNEIEGENEVIAELEFNEAVVMSKGQLWENAGCEFSGSNACGAGY